MTCGNQGGPKLSLKCVIEFKYLISATNYDSSI
jgi:hypothetical protein